MYFSSTTSTKSIYFFFSHSLIVFLFHLISIPSKSIKPWNKLTEDEETSWFDCTNGITHGNLMIILYWSNFYEQRESNKQKILMSLPIKKNKENYVLILFEESKHQRLYSRFCWYYWRRCCETFELIFNSRPSIQE